MDADEHALLCLEALPSTVLCVDRLYVGTDGRLLVDMSYGYTGALGRTFMNMVSSRHNRHSIMLALTTIVDVMDRITRRAEQHLTSPYVRGNQRTYGLITDVTQLCVGQVRRIRLSLPCLYQLIQAIKRTYSVDGTIQHTLSGIMETLGGLEQRLVETSLFGVPGDQERSFRVISQ